LQRGCHLTLWDWFQLVLVLWSWVPSFLPCFRHLLILSIYIVILSKVIVVSSWFNWV
jgi:hypothetical protein